MRSERGAGVNESHEGHAPDWQANTLDPSETRQACRTLAQATGKSPGSGMTGFDWLRCFVKKRVKDDGNLLKSRHAITANAKQSDLRLVA